MAELFLAQDTERSELVVIKRILPYLSHEAEFVQMFLDEARIAGQLHHPNIIQLHELGKLQESIFIAMEFVEGVDARKIAQEEQKRAQTLPYEVVAFITAEICAGLEYAHTSRGVDGRPLEVVHRDISPQNVMVSFDGEVKLVDFGIAKASALVERSKPGVIKGKFLYLSPEQLSQERLDRRADLFALGTMMYELTTGKAPFYKPTTEAVIYAIRHEEAVPPTQVRPDFPQELSRIIMKCLVKDRNRRYQHAAEIQRDLQGFLRTRPFGRHDLVSYVGMLFGTEDERTMVHIPPSALAAVPPPEPRRELSRPLPVGKQQTSVVEVQTAEREPPTRMERAASAKMDRVEEATMELPPRPGVMPPPTRRPSGGRYLAAGAGVEGERTLTTPSDSGERPQLRSGDNEEEVPTLSLPVGRGAVPISSPSSPSISSGSNPSHSFTAPGDPEFDHAALSSLEDSGPISTVGDTGESQRLDPLTDEQIEIPTKMLPRRVTPRAPPPESDEADGADEEPEDEEEAGSSRGPWLFGTVAFVVVLLLGLGALRLFGYRLFGIPDPLGHSTPKAPTPDAPPGDSHVQTEPPQEPEPRPQAGTENPPPTETQTPDAGVEPPPPQPPSANVVVVFRGPRGTLVRHAGQRLKLEERYLYPAGTFTYVYQCPGARRALSGSTELAAPKDSSAVPIVLCRPRR